MSRKLLVAGYQLVIHGILSEQIMKLSENIQKLSINEQL